MRRQPLAIRVVALCVASRRDVGDAGVKAGETRLRLPAVGRALALARQRPAAPPERAQKPAVRLRAGDILPRAQHRQGFHAQVHAHGVPGLLHRLYVLRVHRDRGEPPVGLARHRHPLRHAEKAQFLAHPHPADDRQAQAQALHAERPRLVGRTEARAAVPALEPGIARPLREERPERHAQVDHRLLGGTFRHVIHPRGTRPACAG